jgi:glycosyltransferase involved in cell wall biosynthesis
MSKIKISIIIANYNNEKYIGRCIDSCIKQNINEKYEIILIDDNSSDNSLKNIKKFKEKIKIIKIKKSKKGLKFNTYFQLNTYLNGLLRAKGDIICFLDSDDYFRKNKLSVINNYFLKDSLLEIVFDSPILIDDKKNIIHKKKKFGFRERKWASFPPQSCISIKKNVIIKQKKILFKKKFPLTTLDFRIAALADLRKINTLFLTNKLTYYFQHPNNESNKNFQKFNKNWFKRRLEAYKYYNLVNKKFFKTIDYYLTVFVNYFI